MAPPGFWELCLAFYQVSGSPDGKPSLNVFFHGGHGACLRGFLALGNHEWAC